VLLKPAIIALLVGSFLTGGLLVGAAAFGMHISRHWNLQSGSELQIRLERRTYLVSTLVAYAFAFELISFFLFINTVDKLHIFFVGAMCAAGSLNANHWGYWVIVLRMVNFLLAGLWLILNYVDNQGYDYPLIRKKYLFLLAIVPFILVEIVFQFNYFLGLEPEVITSCCGALFSASGKTIAADIIALPHRPMEIVFFAVMVGLFSLGIFSYRTGKGGYAFALMAFLALIVSLVAFISFISVYIYELPSHHCPFCVLQKEYGYIGYPFFLTLLGGSLTGMGVGMVAPFLGTESLKKILPAIRKKLIGISLGFYAIFFFMVVYQILRSNLRM
jgi:hypothetical protein